MFQVAERRRRVGDDVTLLEGVPRSRQVVVDRVEGHAPLFALLAQPVVGAPARERNHHGAQRRETVGVFFPQFQIAVERLSVIGEVESPELRGVEIESVEGVREPQREHFDLRGVPFHVGGLVPELVGDAAQPPFRAGGRGGHGQYEPEDASQESVHGRIRIGNR